MKQCQIQKPKTDDLWKESCLAWGPQPMLRALLASLTAQLCVTVTVPTTAVGSSQKAQKGLLMLTHNVKHPRANKMQQCHIHPSDWGRWGHTFAWDWPLPVWGCFGGVSSGGPLAMPVTGSFIPGQTERQLQGPEFRNSLKENLVGLFVGRGTWKYALGLQFQKKIA